MQLSMRDGLDLYSLRRVLGSDADHVARSRPVPNTRPTDRDVAFLTSGTNRETQNLCGSVARDQCSQKNQRRLHATKSISSRRDESIGQPHIYDRPPGSTTWKNAGVGLQTCLVSDDAAFDARRPRSLHPPPRFRV